ncbi:hypothetical protein H0H81_002470 [Sphagnurus paluster]|uniref:Uncharacterized protein n=1 Tax=Sphagnurus paluster TaxID=117069 RepID=A0A9P7KIF4_9AGAR|nr:hypothetical protein H0H81_002470 [Sphagnurus paluster]
MTAPSRTGTMKNGFSSILRNLVLIQSIRSTSYDRFWEGRKAIAVLISNIRNLSRQIWVNVALPPTDAQPAYAKGKTPTSDVTLAQLRRRKIEALKLCLSFAFAAKHYLRGEDGVKYDDFHISKSTLYLANFFDFSQLEITWSLTCVLNCL